MWMFWNLREIPKLARTLEPSTEICCNTTVYKGTVILSFYDSNDHKRWNSSHYRSLRLLNFWILFYNIVETAAVGVLIKLTDVGIDECLLCSPPSDNQRKINNRSASSDSNFSPQA
jgi:hypothetical protein